MADLLNVPLQMTTSREHIFYSRFLKVDEKLIFHLDPYKVRQLSNAYLIIQDVIKKELEFWKHAASKLDGDQSIEISVGHIMRHLQNLQDIYDDKIPEKGKEDEIG